MRDWEKRFSPQFTDPKLSRRCVANCCIMSLPNWEIFLLCVDMGGTSFDLSLVINGQPEITCFRFWILDWVIRNGLSPIPCSLSPHPGAPCPPLPPHLPHLPHLPHPPSSYWDFFLR
ncbi:MAG: hypothetical protein MJA27_04175 [Pseudanabaenales cyanobacterium]|nr:hypothetical protein [Pseudanabaenales cyanobacterium]